MQKLKEKVKSDIPSRCYKFSLQTIEFCDKMPNRRTGWVITNQLLRSATSIGANVIEAQASSSRREYKKFFEIALKSANETLYWLNLSKDSKIASVELVMPLIDEAQQLSRILGKSVLTLKSL